MNSKSFSNDNSRGSSVTKIKQLYLEFESLKKRIAVSDKNKDLSIKKFQKQQIQEKNQQQISIKIDNRNDKFKYQNWYILEQYFKKSMSEDISKNKNKMILKINKLQKRLIYLSQLLPQISKLLKRFIQKKKKQSTKSSNTVIDLIRIQRQYKTEIQKLTTTYQGKLDLLMDQIKGKGTTSSTFKSKSKEKEQENVVKNLEERAFINQQKIKTLQAQNLQYKRLLEQNSKIIKDKDDILGQLKTQLKKTKLQIEQLKNEVNKLRQNQQKIKKQSQDKLYKQKIQQYQKLNQYQSKYAKLDKNLKEVINQNTKLKKQTTQLLKKQNKWKLQEKQNIDLIKKNQQLENIINCMKQQIILLKDKQRQIREKYQQIKPQENIIADWNQSAIQRINTMQSQEDVFSGLKPQRSQRVQRDTLRYSHMMNNRQRKLMQIQMQVKQLQSELNLVTEENRLLNSQKDKFEQQVKVSEHDQEKFQQQSKLLKEQRKRLTSLVKILDQCTICLLTNQNIQISKLDNLQTLASQDPSLKFPGEYKKLNKIKQQSK